MTTLTIVIPTTGRETLERARASAWACADDVIVVADGTTDVPASIFVDEGCPGRARNAAIPHVKTEWVGFLDDDDVLIPDVYRENVERHPAVDMVIHPLWHPQLGPVPRPGHNIEHGNIGISFTVKASLFRQEPFIAGPPVTMRGEDYEMVRRFIDKDRTVVMEQRIAYVIHPEEVRLPWPS